MGINKGGIQTMRLTEEGSQTTKLTKEQTQILHALVEAGQNFAFKSVHTFIEECQEEKIEPEQIIKELLEFTNCPDLAIEVKT